MSGCGWTSVPFVNARETCIVVSEAGDTGAFSVSLTQIDGLMEGCGVLYTFLVEIGQHT